MKTTTAWTLLLVGITATLVLPMAHAQSAILNPLPSPLSIPGAAPCVGVQGVSGINSVNDIHTRATETAARSQAVSVTDNDVLLGIALHNNGAPDVTFDKLRSITASASHSITASQTANLDREDVFSALALGIHDSAGSLEALACVSDLTTAATETTATNYAVSLNENTVLLAIAMHNSAGSPLSFEDVANIDQTMSTSVAHDQEVTVPRENAFLALALGAGGSGAMG